MTAESASLRALQGHIAEEATIDHLVRSLKPEITGRVVSGVTETGLAVEDQLRKAWTRTYIGLALP
ncbi:MAG TPA: hypothetical protein VFW46_18595 [Stellaceae bacterium]|jgi:hypothetical protein|nr:hypothetical protein [Stellaceae bacterium]